MNITAAFTPEAVKDILFGAGFGEWEFAAEPGFVVAKAAFGHEIVVWLRGVDLMRYNPHEGPRVLVDEYLEALDLAGYEVRSTGSEVVVAGVKR